MRSYNSLIGRVKNQETKEVNNLAIGLQSLASTGSLVASGGGGGNYDASINYLYDNYATIAYVDANAGGGNVDLSGYTTKTYVDTSLNTNYLTSASLSSYATKTYVDTSLNTNYATKSYVDTSLNTNYATSSSLSSYATIAYVDSSLGYYTTSSYANANYLKSGLTYDVSMTGNVQLGSGTKYVAINKTPGSTYALDVSGPALITGNLSLYKNPSDLSYSYLDLSGVNINIFGTIEKFKTTTYASTSLTLDCANGTIFDISGVTASITAITFTSVPATLGQSVSLTVLLRQNPAAKYYFSGGPTISVNGITCTFLKPDSTALSAPSNNSSVVILQFVVLWVSLTAPVVMTYMSAQG